MTSQATHARYHPRTMPAGFGTSRWAQLKAQVYAEETACHLCGGTWFTDIARHRLSRSVDHVIPRSLGGNMWDRTNLRLAHYGCNSRRGNGRRGRTQPRTTRGRWVKAENDTHTRQWL